jgi:hypothetical protein
MTEEQILLSLEKEIEQLKEILKSREEKYEKIKSNSSSFTTLFLQDQDCC